MLALSLATSMPKYREFEKFTQLCPARDPAMASRPFRTRHVTGSGLQLQRWVSYDRAALARDAIRQKVEAGLGDDTHGNPLRIDTESKTISTAAGALPLSPVLDPAWIKATRRQRKDDPGQRMGRFRKKLANNPYGQQRP